MDELPADVQIAIKKYDKPQIAQGVWSEYIQDIERRGKYDHALGILERCRTADQLDIRLANLIEKAERKCAGR